MSTPDFLSQLRRLDIVIGVEGGQIQVSAPRKVLTAELREELAIRKPEILAFLSDSKQLVRSDFPAIEQIPRAGELPLSFAQMRLWFLEQLDPGSPAYIMPVAARLRGNLDFSILQKSLSEIVRRHEVLRTVFPAVNGWPRMVIQAAAPVSVDVSDLTDLPLEEREPKAREILEATVTKSFDLTNGPLVRVQLLRIHNDDHVLLLTVHHAVFDGWSVDVFWREFSTLYCAFRAGEPSPLPELPIQFADFAVWQRRCLEGPVRESHLAFWKKQLDGCLPSLDLPTDRPRSDLHTRRSASKTLHTNPAVCESLKSLSQREGASLFMVLLAAFNVLLHRLSGQDDILVGTPIAGRNRTELEEMIGFFINTVVVRTRLSGSGSFRDLLAQVRNTVLDAYGHQDMPFEELVDAFDVHRDLSRSPLFQVFFNHLNLPVASVEIPGLEIETSLTSESKFDLTLYSTEQNGSIQLSLLYDPELFEEPRMEILLDQYALLLDQICDDPSRPVDSYSLLTSSSAHSVPDPTEPLAVQWFGSVHARFVEQAVRAPERVAIIEEGSQWSYGRLESVSAGLAEWLRRQEVGSGDVVAVCGHRCASFVAALLGVLRAGAAFCILDPAYPALRLIRTVRAARPKAWLQIETVSDLSSVLETAVEETVANRRLTIPQSDEAISRLDLPAGPPTSVDVDPDCAAYVTFTSGTTGNPKCILGTHRPLSHFIAWHVREFDLKASDRFSMLSGLAHDPLLRDIFTPLWVGATLCIPSQDDIFLPERLSIWMKQQQITVAHSTPAMASLLTEPSGERTQQLLPALRYVFFGGDVLSPRDVALVTGLAPQVACINFYGTTETPQAVAWCPIDPNQDLPSGGATTPARPYPIGSPIADTQVLILNRAGTLSGPGELGEIYVRTPYLSRGYINDEALTCQRFVTNPYTGQSSDRLYRTGDLGRYHPDGLVEFAGRADQQVKIRGHRIEPGEIEAALGDHSGIQACAVVAREVRSGNKQLVAYLVARNGQHFIPQELRTFLRKHLPDYMIPVAFIVLLAMPLTPNGKVDRRALALREEDPLQPVEAYVPPTNHVERVMAKIWREVLDVDKVGVFDNFFEFGGHSLSATRLIARLRSTFNMDLPLRCIFVDPTIAGLAKHIRYDVSTQNYRYVSEIPTWNCLVPAQPKGTRTPLFFVGGFQNPDDPLLVLSRFFPHLGPDQPVFGFKPRWIEGAGEGYASVEEVAREFLAGMRTIQPKGPYLLGGLCVGGIVAFELAQQLIREGEEVRLLALLDTERPTSLRALLANFRLICQRGKHVAAVISEVIHANDRSRRDIISDLVRRKLRIANPKKADRPATDRFYDLKIAYRRLMYRYSPRQYPGRITLFVNEEHSRFDRDMGWKGVVEGGLNVHKLPGDHHTLLSLYGKEFAQLLRKCIDDAVPGPSRQADRTGVGVS